MQPHPRRPTDLELIQLFGGPRRTMRGWLSRLVSRWIESCVHMDYFGLALTGGHDDVVEDGRSSVGAAVPVTGQRRELR